MKALKYRIVLKKDPDEGVYIVSVPSLPGCHTFGKTVEEAIEMAKEAIEGYIETLIDLGKEVPTEIAKPSYPAFDCIVPNVWHLNTLPSLLNLFWYIKISLHPQKELV